MFLICTLITVAYPVRASSRLAALAMSPSLRACPSSPGGQVCTLHALGGVIGCGALGVVTPLQGMGRAIGGPLVTPALGAVLGLALALLLLKKMNGFAVMQEYTCVFCDTRV